MRLVFFSIFIKLLGFSVRQPASGSPSNSVLHFKLPVYPPSYSTKISAFGHNFRLAKNPARIKKEL